MLLIEFSKLRSAIIFVTEENMYPNIFYLIQIYLSLENTRKKYLVDLKRVKSFIIRIVT